MEVNMEITLSTRLCVAGAGTYIVRIMKSQMEKSRDKSIKTGFIPGLS